MRPCAPTGTLAGREASRATKASEPFTAPSGESASASRPLPQWRYAFRRTDTSRPPATLPDSGSLPAGMPGITDPRTLRASQCQRYSCQHCCRKRRQRGGRGRRDRRSRRNPAQQARQARDHGSLCQFHRRQCRGMAGRRSENETARRTATPTICRSGRSPTRRSGRDAPPGAGTPGTSPPSPFPPPRHRRQDDR